MHRRLTIGQWLGLRLTLAGLAIFLVTVPFAGVLALVDVGWGPLRSLDEGATKSLNAYALEHRTLIRPLQATSYIFHAWVFRVVVIALAAWLFIRKARWLATWAVTTLALGGVLGLVLKVLVDRPRPRLPAPIAHAPGGSFPSGHALTAALGCGLIVLILLPLLRSAWRVVAWVLAGLVTLAAGCCRVALGVHYVSDVVAGWALGAAVVIATTAAFEIWRRERGRPAIAPARDGVGPEELATAMPGGSSTTGDHLVDERASSS